MSRCCCSSGSTKQKKTEKQQNANYQVNSTARNSINSTMQQNDPNRPTMQQPRPTGTVYEANPAMQSYAQPGAPQPYARPTYQSSYAAQGQQPMRQTYEQPPMAGSVAPAYTQQSMNGSQPTYSPRNSAIPLPADYIQQQQQQQQQANCPCPKKTTYTIKIPSRRKATNSMACETLLVPQNDPCRPCETLLIPQTALAASSARPCETVLIPESSSSPSKNLRTLVFRLPVPAANESNGDNGKKRNSEATDEDTDVKTTRKVKKTTKRRSSTRKDDTESESEEDEKSTKKKNKSKKNEKRGSKSESKRKSITSEDTKKKRKSRSKSSESSESEDEEESVDYEFIGRPANEMCCCRMADNQNTGCCCSAQPPKCCNHENDKFNSCTCASNQNDDFKSCTCAPPPQSNNNNNNGNSCYIHKDQQRPSAPFGDYMDRNRLSTYENGQQTSLFKRPPGCTCTDQDLIEGILGSQRKTQCFVHRSKSTAYMEPNKMRQFDIFQQDSEMLDERRASNTNRPSSQFRRSNDFAMNLSKSAGQVDRGSWKGMENDEPLETDIRCTCQEELMRRKCEEERKKMCSCIYKKQKLKEMCPDVALDEIVFNCNCAKVAKKEAKKKAELKKCKAMKACCAKKKGADSDLDSNCCCQSKKKAKKEKKRCCDELKKNMNCDLDSDSDSDSSTDCIEREIAKQRKAKICKLLKEKQKERKCEKLKEYCCDEKKKHKIECVLDSDFESDSSSCDTELKCFECPPKLKEKKDKKGKTLEKKKEKIKECFCDEKALKRAIKERKKAEKKAEKEAKKEAKRKEKYCKELAKISCAKDNDSCCSFETKNHRRSSKNRSSTRSNKDQFCCGDKQNKSQVCCDYVHRRSKSPCCRSHSCSDEEYFSAHSQRSKCDHRRRDHGRRSSYSRSQSRCKYDCEPQRQSCCGESRSKCNHGRSNSCSRSQSRCKYDCEPQRQSCCGESRSKCNHGRSNSCSGSQSRCKYDCEQQRPSCCGESRSKCNHGRSNSCSRSQSRCKHDCEPQRQNCCGDSILESELQDSCSDPELDCKSTKSNKSIKEAKLCCKFENKLCKLKCKTQLEKCKSALIGIADPKKQKALCKLEKKICMIKCKDQLKSCKTAAKTKNLETQKDSHNKKSRSSSPKKQSIVRSKSKERIQSDKYETCCCPVENEPKSCSQSSKSLSKGCPVGKSRSQKSHPQKLRSKSPSISNSKEKCCCRPSQHKSGRMHAGEIENDDAAFCLKIKDLIYKHQQEIEANSPPSTKQSFFRHSDEKLPIMPTTLKNEVYKPHIICESSIQTDSIIFPSPHVTNGYKDKDKLVNFQQNENKNYEFSDQSTKSKKKERFSFNPKNLLKRMKPKSESKTTKEDLKLLKTKEKLQSWLEPSKNALSRIDYHSSQVSKTKRSNNELNTQTPKTPTILKHSTKEILQTERTKAEEQNNKQIKNENVTRKPTTVTTELPEESKSKKAVEGSNDVSTRSRHTRETPAPPLDLKQLENKNDGKENAEKPVKMVTQREESDPKHISSKKDGIEIIKQRREAPKPTSTMKDNRDNEEKPIKIKKDLSLSEKKDENPMKVIKERREEPKPISTKNETINNEETPIKIKKERVEEPKRISTKNDSTENAKYPMEKIKHRMELTNDNPENRTKIKNPIVENYESKKQTEESDANKAENTPGYSKRETPKVQLDREDTNPNKEFRDTGGENIMYKKIKKDIPNNNNYFQINTISKNFKSETDRIESKALHNNKSELSKNSNVQNSKAESKPDRRDKGERSKEKSQPEEVNDKKRNPFVFNQISFKDDDKRFLIEKFLQSEPDNSLNLSVDSKIIEKEYAEPLEKSIKQKNNDRDKYHEKYVANNQQEELHKELVSSCSRRNKTKLKSLSNGHEKNRTIEKMIPKHVKIKRKSLGLRKIKRLESETEEIITSRKPVRKLKKIKTRIATKYDTTENSALENIKLAIKRQTRAMSKVQARSHHFS